MLKFVQKSIRSPHFQDAMGVLRGVAKVNSQILKRTNYMSSDIQRFSKNIEEDLLILQDKLIETTEFLQAAQQTFDIDSPIGEFVTFEKPEFDYEEEKRLYQEKAKNVKESEDENLRENFEEFDFMMEEEDSLKNREEEVKQKEQMLESKQSQIDLGKQVPTNPNRRIPEKNGAKVLNSRRKKSA